MQAKRILYTVLSGDIAGGQMVCFNMMKAARQAGYEVVLLSQTDGPFTELVKSIGIKVYVVFLRRSFYFHKIPAIISILKREKIDLVHSHDIVSGNIMLRIAAKLAGVPVISHMHIKNHYNNFLFNKIYARALDNMTARFCSKIIAVGMAVKKDLIVQGYPENNIEVVCNGVEIDEEKNVFLSDDLLEDLNLREDFKIFLHVGRFCKDKGQADLIHAASEVIKQEPLAHFVFAGEDIVTDGLYAQKLNELVKSLKIEDNIRFLGLRKDVRDLLKMADCLVLPSYLEGLPIVILEAMAEKKPVIAYNIDGVSEEVVDKETGYLVDEGNVGALAGAILKIINNPEQAKILGDNGYNLASKKFNFKDKINRILQIYKEIFE